eukprot:COSAG06_NODE_3146_length_5778_cov_3.027294_4_plen_157_part_00
MRVLTGSKWRSIQLQERRSLVVQERTPTPSVSTSNGIRLPNAKPRLFFGCRPEFVLVKSPLSTTSIELERRPDMQFKTVQTSAPVAVARSVVLAACGLAQVEDAGVERAQLWRRELLCQNAIALSFLRSSVLSLSWQLVPTEWSGLNLKWRWENRV